MAKKRHHDGGKMIHEAREREHYAGHDQARAEERHDFHIIKEDKHAVANLPQEVIMKPFPRMKYGLDPYLDDTISGIDSQQYADEKQMHKGLSKSKY